MKLLSVSLLVCSFLSISLAAADRFACNMKALTTAERARHRELSEKLFPTVDEKRELPNGYAFRLPPANLVSAAEWVSFERKCCPFFTFELEQSKNQGPLWLRITGADGVKQIIAEEFQL